MTPTGSHSSFASFSALFFTYISFSFVMLSFDWNDVAVPCLVSEKTSCCVFVFYPDMSPETLRYKFWCKIGICSWNLFLKLPLMLSNPLPVVVLHHFEAYQSLFCPKQHQNHLQLVRISQRNL